MLVSIHVYEVDVLFKGHGGFPARFPLIIYKQSRNMKSPKVMNNI